MWWRMLRHRSCLLRPYEPYELALSSRRSSSYSIILVMQVLFLLHSAKQEHYIATGCHMLVMPQPGFDIPRQQWSLLNRFCTEQGDCGACRRKWRLTDTDLCPCGETQTMSHIVESCPLTKLNDGLSRLHSADEDAVSWLTVMVHDMHTRRRRLPQN